MQEVWDAYSGMASSKVLRTVGGPPGPNVVNCHAFSQDFNLLAICFNDETIHIFEPTNDGAYEVSHELSKHRQRVTDLSFSPGNHLLSVAEDRGALVWERRPGEEEWTPAPVLMQARRAALCVSWSPDGSCFAVGLGSPAVAVCSWQQDMWVGSNVSRKFRASVRAVAWYPVPPRSRGESSISELGPQFQLFATGSADGSCRVLDAAGRTKAKFKSDTWVNSVAFSPSGQALAFAAQDSYVNVVVFRQALWDIPGEVAKQDMVCLPVMWPGLPFLRIAFLDDGALIAGGFDRHPVVFRREPRGWGMGVSLDEGCRRLRKSRVPTTFGQVDDGLKLPQDVKAKDTDTAHTNVITGLRALNEKAFSTSGLDGQVIVWQMS